ncbi:MAG: VOC family protein [Parafilimonas sp.]
MTQINAYIGFNGKCREAMNFYKECLGGELVLQTIGESPMKEHCAAGTEGQILHSSLMRNDVLLLMGTDMVGPTGYTEGNNIALSLNCSTEEEINTFFSKLSEGGKIFQEVKPQFWGSLFGMLTDKFGINWMLNYEMHQQKK